MQINVYIDDSYDQQQDIVAVAGAMAGTVNQWNDLNRAWLRTLKREGVQYFRSTEYFRLRGQFGIFRDPNRYPAPAGSEAAKEILDNLEDVVTRSKIVGRAVCVPLGRWKILRTNCACYRQILNNPFELAIQVALAEISKVVKGGNGSSHEIAFAADEGPSARRIEKVYLEFKRINNSFDAIKSFTHLDDKENPQLQVADMMAGIAREFYLERSKGASIKVPMHLSNRIGDILCPTNAYLTGLLDHEVSRRGLRCHIHRGIGLRRSRVFTADFSDAEFPRKSA